MKKKKEVKTTAVATSNRRLAWGGVMPKPTGQQEVAVAKFINKVAWVYGVPSMGLNVMGDKPYLNKDGRLFLLHDFRKGKEGYKSIKTEYLQMSKNLEEASICKVTILFKDGHEVEAVGEASKQSVKLDAVKQTLNMMAETRAMNRAIWKEIAGDAWERVSSNLGRAKLSKEEESKLIDAGRVSYEEMQQPNPQDEAPVASTPQDLEVNLKQKVDGCSDVGKLIEIDEKLSKSPLYKPTFKKIMHSIIAAKVSSLEK